MRRWIGFLLRLYPPVWRERYGVEFDALLDEAPLSGADFLNVLQEAIKMRITTWTAKQILLSSTLSAMVLAAAVALWLPNWYLTTAVLQLRAGPVATLTQVAENTLSRTVLAGLIDRHGLYPQERGRMAPDDLVNLMRHDIRVATVTSSTRGSTGVELQFRYPDPQGLSRLSVNCHPSFRKAQNCAARSGNQRRYRPEPASNRVHRNVQRTSARLRGIVDPRPL